MDVFLRLHAACAGQSLATLLATAFIPPDSNGSGTGESVRSVKLALGTRGVMPSLFHVPLWCNALLSTGTTLLLLLCMHVALDLRPNCFARFCFIAACHVFIYASHFRF